AEYILRWLPRGTHDWNKFVTPRELEDAIGAGGFSVRDVRGVFFNPLGGVWSESGDTDVNYMLVAGR
ncbi:MAG: bifunctional 2-polyprenyl-6-hydroxyphenol methylase/3-demethylubiquinol 3-O-methyltransferase UbiG, partial [Beijerinckiaceae bacterium]